MPACLNCTSRVQVKSRTIKIEIHHQKPSRSAHHTTKQITRLISRHCASHNQSHPANVLHAKPRCLTSCQLLCQSHKSISMNIKLLALKPPATIFKAPPCTAIPDFTEKRCPSKTCTRTVQPANLAMAISMSAPLDQFLLSQ